MCECVPKQASKSLEPLPLEVDLFVSYSDPESAARAAKAVSHCVIRREGTSYVCGPDVVFIDDAIMAADALAQRTRRREKDQAKVEKWHEEQEKCTRALHKAQENLDSIIRETAHKREALSGRVVIDNVNDCFKAFVNTHEKLQTALDSNASREELKVSRRVFCRYCGLIIYCYCRIAGIG